MTFREILDSDVAKYATNEQYEKAGLKVVENTPEEILDLAIEMNKSVDGTIKYSEEDEKLQKKFKSLFKPHHVGYDTPARIGTEFLKKNKELLK